MKIYLQLILIFTISACSAPKHGIIEEPKHDNDNLYGKHYAYSFMYDEKNEQSDWVAYQLLASELEKNHKRTNKFLEDTIVISGTANNSDYKYSGYDKGHLAPAADMTWNKQAMKELDVLSKVKEGLESAVSVRALDFSESEREEFIKPLQLITDKPVLYVCNVDDASAVSGNDYVEAVKASIKNEVAEILILAVGTEADIRELDDYDERQMFLEDIGLSEPGVSKLIRSAYKLLNLQTYLTAGVKEVRAWTIHIGDTAPQAAGVIHTDFEKGFIRAEVIKYNDFVHYGSEIKVREAGKLAVEGKEYVVQDGDMMNFRFNV